MIVYAGFLMVWARGDEANISKSNDIIRFAIIGIIVMIAAYAIVNTLIRLGGGTYKATFEVRDLSGGVIIGANIIEGHCLTTTLPLAGEIDICNESKYLSVESDSPLLPKLVWPMSEIEGYCADLKIGAYVCLNASNKGTPIDHLIPKK